MASIPLVALWRGDFLESQHRGHAIVCNLDGSIRDVWGDADAMILPRSSCKMIQALPLIRSGAATRFGLTSEQLALACASHQGAAIHTERVGRWLDDLGLSDDDFRCGPQEPSDKPARNALIRADEKPCQIHNNCSGKHAGFLTLSQHLNAGPEYHEYDHPVQLACAQAHWETCETPDMGWVIDGCSAPNLATTMQGLARAMAKFAGDADPACAMLRDAMMAHPELVAGETRACTELMRAAPGVALKTGAEAVYTAILPAQKIGIAVKIEDGAFRASEAVITALLIKYGALDAAHPAALRRLGGPIKNWAGREVAHMRMAPGF